MIKTIETDIGTYYFDSVNFTLSLSPISKQSSPTLDSVEDGVLKKVGKYRFRAFGKYNYAPLYDLYQYAQMTDDAMEDMLKK